MLAGANLDDLLARVDIQKLVDRVDIQGVIAKVDPNAVIERVDIDAIVEQTEFGSLIARSGSAVMGQVVDTVRSQSLGLDNFVHRWVNRVLRRDSAVPPGAPPLLQTPRHKRDVEPTCDDGRPGAGGTLRRLRDAFVAFAVDVATIVILFAIGGRVFEFVFTLLLREKVVLSDAPTVSTVAFVGWAFLYCAYPLATAGRTFGMAALGLRAVQVDGRELGRGKAVLRVVVFPLSFLLLGLGFVLILLRRDRRALHDLIARSAVVYAWDARAARVRFLAKH